MSRAIFIEGFLWVIRARFTGDKEVRRLPPTARISAGEQLDTARAPQTTNPG
jgi:hypothetical protein